MDNLGHYFYAALDLMFLAWPALPNDAFLGDAQEVDDYTAELARSKIDELNSILTPVCQTPGSQSACTH
jgi:hypothetical protein